MKILKGFAKCPIVEDSDLLNKLIERLLDLEKEGEFGTLTEEAGKAIAIILQSDRSCSHHLKKRVAAKFEENDELQDAHNNLMQAQEDVERLQRETAEAIQRMNSWEGKRWDIAIKNFGLSPENYFYTLDESKGTITQMDLDCNACKGRTMVRKKRQEVAQKVIEIGKRVAEEAKNDESRTRPGVDTPEGSPGEGGEASNAEQEVQGVADQPTSSGGDGDNSSGETA
jgi:hypothetical protein